jgi:hypothetical protein
MVMLLISGSTHMFAFLTSVLSVSSVFKTSQQVIQEKGVPIEVAACEAAGLGPSDGREFAAPGFIRINTACPTERLEEALRRLRRAFIPG